MRRFSSLQRAGRFVVALSLLPLSAVLAQTDEKHEADYQEIPSDLPKPAGEGADREQASREILKGINEIRQKEDLTSLERDEHLTKAARGFADFMASTHRYGHTADGRRPSQRAENAGYRYCAVRENIAYQYGSEDFSAEELANDLVEGWMESPGHRKNILSRYSMDTGVAVARSEKTGGYFAVQLFGRPESAGVRFKIVNETKETVSYSLTVEGLSDEGRTVEMAPGTIRIHERCRPVEVRVSGGVRAEAIPMEDGARLRVLPTQGEGLEVRVEQTDLEGEASAETGEHPSS